jgi:ubiquinone/menaquinone biosynthesis C-methylase UbiE
VEKIRLGVVMRGFGFCHDEGERRKWQNPEAILLNVGLKSGLTFVDVGCGYGFFALPAARIVGDHGKVYGLDIDKEAISWLRKKAAEEGLRNVVLRVGAAEETVFCEACADIVFYGIVFHDFDNPGKVLANSKKMLKPNGHLIDLDWRKEPMDLGPRLRIRLSEDEAVGLMEQAGFKVKAKKESGSFHYIIIAKT